MYYVGISFYKMEIVLKIYFKEYENNGMAISLINKF